MNHNCYYLGDGLIISMRLTARRPKTDRERVGSSLNETGKSDGREYTNPPPFFFLSKCTNIRDITGRLEKIESMYTKRP